MNVANNPAKAGAPYADTDVNNDGVVDVKDVPQARKMFVTKEPDSRRVLMTDAVSLWGGAQTWRINHGPDYGSYSIAGDKPPLLIDQNVGYGDGHVVLKRAHQFPEALRKGDRVSALRRTINFVQPPADFHWW
jgi:hypothetical protein